MENRYVGGGEKWAQLHKRKIPSILEIEFFCNSHGWKRYPQML